MDSRDVQNREEDWLLDALDECGADDASFRSRDFIVVEDGTERLATGRVRRHKFEDREVCEITSVCVLKTVDSSDDTFRTLLEALVERAAQFGSEYVYAFPRNPDRFLDYGFEQLEHQTVTGELRQRLQYKQNDLDTTLPTVLGELSVVREQISEERDNSHPSGEDVSAEEVEQLASEMRPNTQSEVTHKYSTGE